MWFCEIGIIGMKKNGRLSKVEEVYVHEAKEFGIWQTNGERFRKI